MNYRMITQMLGRVITIEAALLAVPMAVSLIYGESPLPFLYVMALCALVGGALWRVKPVNHDMYAREGFAQVGRRPNYYRDPREDALILRKEWEV